MIDSIETAEAEAAKALQPDSQVTAVDGWFYLLNGAFSLARLGILSKSDMQRITDVAERARNKLVRRPLVIPVDYARPGQDVTISHVLDK